MAKKHLKPSERAGTLQQLIPAEMAFLFRNPRVLSTEDPDDHTRIVAQLVATFHPKDFVAWTLVKDAADTISDIRRWQRAKTAVPHINHRSALERILSARRPLAAQEGKWPYDLAVLTDEELVQFENICTKLRTRETSEPTKLQRGQYDPNTAATRFYRDENVRKEISAVLAQERLDASSIDDLSVSLSITEIEKLDRLIENKQKHLDKTLRQLEIRKVGPSRNSAVAPILEMDGTEISVVPEHGKAR